MLQDKWYQIEISKGEVPTDGKHLIELMTLIIQYSEAEYIVLDDLVGAIGEKLYGMKLPRVIDFKTFKEIAKNAFQFDWGDFYLLNNKMKASKLVGYIKKIAPCDKFYYLTLPFTETTIRVFDDYTLIIYTKNRELFHAIREYYVDYLVVKSYTVEGGQLSDLKFYS